MQTIRNYFPEFSPQARACVLIKFCPCEFEAGQITQAAGCQVKTSAAIWRQLGATDATCSSSLHHHIAPLPPLFNICTVANLIWISFKAIKP